MTSEEYDTLGKYISSVERSSWDIDESMNNFDDLVVIVSMLTDEVKRLQCIIEGLDNDS